MSQPLKNTVSDKEIEEGAKIARRLIGLDEYKELHENYVSSLEGYHRVDDSVIIEMATDVVNGEYPQLFDQFDYNGEKWTVQDFVEHCAAWSSTPFGRERDMEKRGTTQAGDEALDIHDIAENQNNFSGNIYDSPPKGSEFEGSETGKYFEIHYATETGFESFTGFGEPVRMVDVLEPDEDASDQHYIYWPE